MESLVSEERALNMGIPARKEGILSMACFLSFDEIKCRAKRQMTLRPASVRQGLPKAYSPYTL